MDNIRTALHDIERQVVFYDLPAPSGKSAVRVLQGTTPVLISAPHSVRHWRNNQWKQEEEYTAALGYLLHQETGASFIYGQYLLNPDPHDDDDCGEYKQAIDRLIKATPIQCALDLHGARGDRDFAVAFGTMRGESFGLYETQLQITFERYGFLPDPDSSLDRLVMNPSRYTGGLLQPTITRYLWRKHHIPSVQIELTAWVRIVERLPNATNTRNGIAPHFRGDTQRIIRVYNALRAFIQEIAKHRNHC
jgi:hypothetical protein